jgi:hypothetical protein
MPISVEQFGEVVNLLLKLTAAICVAYTHTVTC